MNTSFYSIETSTSCTVVPVRGKRFFMKSKVNSKGQDLHFEEEILVLKGKLEQRLGKEVNGVWSP